MTDQALKRKAFLKGLKSFYFGNTPKKKPTTSDAEALHQDWVTVGNTLRGAMNDYDRERNQK